MKITSIWSVGNIAIVKISCQVMIELKAFNVTCYNMF